MKIGIVVSHPIQHFCPQYVSFANHENITLKVFFGSALGYKKYMDQNFKEEISWGNLNLNQFDHVFLNGDAVMQADKNLDADNLEAELLAFGPHLLIGYGYFQKLQRRAKSWASQQAVPFAYISDAEGRQQRNRIKSLVKALLIKRYFKKIAFFLTVGDANEMYYRKHGVGTDKMLRMHFPIDVKAYQVTYDNRITLNQEIRKKYNIADQEIILAVVGKLSPWKNQDHIIDAMAILEKKHIYVHLFMVGSGEMKETWERKAAVLTQSKVYFPGFVPIDVLPAYYAATDVYVHPASVEPHSIAISEAIYMACPIVLSDRCGSYGATDDVTDGENGIVYPFGNIQALANAIEQMIVDSSLRAKYAEQSHMKSISFQQVAHATIIDKLVVAVAD